MRALVYTGPKTLDIQEVENPANVNDDIIVKVQAVGICGSDMHAWRGEDERRAAPLILGHEVAGDIVEGKDAGRRVTVNPLVSCMKCSRCLSGRTNLCASRQIISMHPRQGGFAQFISISESNLVDIPDHISYQKAALTEPISVAWHAISLAKKVNYVSMKKSRTLIIGGGAIGIACALVCKHFGSDNIFIAETNQLRHPIIARSGQFNVFEPGAQNAPQESSFDLIVDAFGSEGTQKMSCEFVKAGGNIVNIGLAGGKTGLDVRKMTLQDISFMGSYTYTHCEFKATATAMFNGDLGDLDWFVSYPLDDGPFIFNQIDSGLIEYPKVILIPNG